MIVLLLPHELTSSSTSALTRTTTTSREFQGKMTVISFAGTARAITAPAINRNFSSCLVSLQGQDSASEAGVQAANLDAYMAFSNDNPVSFHENMALMIYGTFGVTQNHHDRTIYINAHVVIV